MIEYLRKKLGIDNLEHRVTLIEGVIEKTPVTNYYLEKEREHVTKESQRYDEVQRVQKLRRKQL